MRRLLENLCWIVSLDVGFRAFSQLFSIYSAFPSNEIIKCMTIPTFNPLVIAATFDTLLEKRMLGKISAQPHPFQVHFNPFKDALQLRKTI